MRDVFLSYAREDQPSALLLLEALQQQGFSVWWDREIVPSQNWQRRIEDAIRQARCVVVLWTPHSAASDYVREEASFAREQEKFLPVLVVDADIPVPFRLIQTADLRDWDGGADHSGLRDLAAGVRACIGRSAVPEAPPEGATRHAAGKRDRRLLRARLTALSWVLLPSIVVALSVLALMRWPAPTTVEIDAVVTRLQFRSAGEDRPFLESTPTRSMALRGFREVRLSGAEVWMANPAQYDLKRDTYPEAAWKALAPEPSLVLRPADRAAATVTILPAGRSDHSLVLDPIYTGPADITLESPEKGSLLVRMRGPKQEVSLPREFRIVADHCVKEGRPLPYQSPSVTLRVRLRQNTRLHAFSSAGSGVLLALELSPDWKQPVLAKTGPAVEAVQFLDQGRTGEPESTLVGPGAIRYEEYPGVDPVRLNANDFLIVEDLRRFRLLRAAPGEQAKSLQVSLHGVAGRLASGPAGFVRDRRRTRFDSLWRSPTLATLFTVLVWLVPTLAGVRSFYRELHR